MNATLKDIETKNWGETVTCFPKHAPGIKSELPNICHLIRPSHLTDNLEWQERPGGYICSSLAHFTIVTEATEMVLETVDFAHCGDIATPVVLNGDELILKCPALPATRNSQFIQLDLTTGLKQLKIVNSLQSNGGWDCNPANHTIRAIYSDTPLFLALPIQSGQKLKMVIYGDSIAAGDHADTPAMQAWGAILRKKYDVALYASGWKRMQDDFENFDIIAKRTASWNPDIIWIAIGVNDYQGPNPVDTKTFAEKYRIFLETLRTRMSKVKIIAQSPIIKTNEHTQNVAGHNLADYRTVIKQTAEDVVNCEYAEGLDILLEPDLIDGVHPHTQGMAKYAKWATEFLNKQNI